MHEIINKTASILESLSLRDTNLMDTYKISIFKNTLNHIKNSEYKTLLKGYTSTNQLSEQTIISLLASIDRNGNPPKNPIFPKVENSSKITLGDYL